MNTRTQTKHITIAALLIAIGILIPMISPLKIILEPASFTLASHVATMIAMFLSPGIAVAVAFGTAVGFMLGGFPLVVVLRAATHMIFSYVGAKYIQKHPEMAHDIKKSLLFSLVLGVLHAGSEVIVVSLFYFAGNLTTAYYDKGLISSVMLLVGVGTVIHSMVDYWLAQIVWKTVGKKALPLRSV
ncbi:hypothetical protein PH235_09440 [Trichococcus sp. K1Tr]|uniref:hypothetical protein n=1 Tax=Trichococcus TaxID=82802 RepID=UPI00232EA42C|nr:MULTISPECIES: hypothetical protein [Trichococcus]MDB6353781.1 hypothetical protein [Trichococcus sp. K1Tr]